MGIGDWRLAIGDWRLAIGAIGGSHPLSLIISNHKDDPTAIHPPTDSLLAILLNSPPEPDPTFDPEEWDRQWAKVEAELNAQYPRREPTAGSF